MQCIRLHQNAFQLDRLQQLPKRLGFAAGISGVGGLGNRAAQTLGIQAPRLRYASPGITPQFFGRLM